MSLPTKEEFVRSRSIEPGLSFQPYGPPEYLCPKCSEGGMCKDLVKGIALASLPPIYQDIYHCNKCGYEETISSTRRF